MRGQHEHHYKQDSDKEENKGWFAILLLQSLQSYAATCEGSGHFLGTGAGDNFAQLEKLSYPILNNEKVFMPP